MKWCRNALSDGVVRAARHVGQAPLACPVLGTVRVAEAPGSRAAAGRRAAIAERPLGLEGRPGNLRGANHTFTDVTGRATAAPDHRWWALPLPDGARYVGVADARTDGREIVRCQRCGCSPGGREPVAVQGCRPGKARVRPPRVSMAIAISASGEW